MGVNVTTPAGEAPGREDQPFLLNDGSGSTR